MAIRDARLDRHKENAAYQRWMRKANQEWEMAGLARQDGDRTAEQQHTDRAREFEVYAHEAL